VADGSDRLRVALVAHDVHDGGGMERAFAELVRHKPESTDIVVYSTTLSPELRTDVIWKRIPVLRRPFPVKFALFFAIASIRLLRARADVVHTLGAIVAPRADLATVQFCHAGFVSKAGALAPYDAPVHRRVNRALSRVLALAAERWCYRPGRLAAFAAVSHGVKRELVEHYPGIPVILTPNGVDPDRYRPDRAARDSIRGCESVREDEIVLLFVGSDWEHKGLALVIEALGVLRDVAPGWRVWVVGRGDRPRYEQLASSLGVSGRLRFFGPRVDVERFYQASDVFVFPTQYETFSLVAYEAAATGLPVVATRVSGIEDLVVDGRTGFVVRRDTEDIAAALLQLVQAQVRSRIGAEARSRATEYTWQRSVASVLSAYRAVRGATEVLAA
jgi:glycosyltransferase involved in cell wall biosynthesis